MITREAIDAFPATSANYADIFRLIGEFEFRKPAAVRRHLPGSEQASGGGGECWMADSGGQCEVLVRGLRRWSADQASAHEETAAGATGSVVDPDPVGFETFCRIRSRIRSRIRLKQKLFAGSRSVVGSGINNFGTASGQPLSRMNLKQNFSDKIHKFSTKCTIKI